MYFLFSKQKKEDDKEELDFMFDEEIEDAPLDICGRKNTFTDWYVVNDFRNLTKAVHIRSAHKKFLDRVSIEYFYVISGLMTQEMRLMTKK